MNKKICKFIMTTMILILLTLICGQNCYSATGKTLTQRFQGTSSDTTSGENIIQKVIGAVLSAVRIIATGIALIMITYLGIKYMSAAPSERANIKNQLITFTIGAIVVFGTTSLLDIIKDFATKSTEI